jgi:serine/threonine protein kinase
MLYKRSRISLRLLNQYENEIFKITNFGSARNIEDDSMAMNPIGTSFYMTLEEIGFLLDISNIGCILYEMIP